MGRKIFKIFKKKIYSIFLIFFCVFRGSQWKKMSQAKNEANMTQSLELHKMLDFITKGFIVGFLVDYNKQNWKLRSKFRSPNFLCML